METKYSTAIGSLLNFKKALSGFLLLFSFVIFMGFSDVYAQGVSPVEITTAGGYGEKKLSQAPRKVYISEFRVMYQLMFTAQDTDNASRTLGGGMRGKSTASLTVGLKGVDVPELQELTNKLYADFSGKLKSEGFELVNAPEAGKTEPLADWELKEGGQPNEAQFKGYLMTTPAGFQYYVKRTTDSGKEKKSFLDNTTKISRDLGGAIVAKVNILVPMVEDAESAGSKMLKDAVAGLTKVVLRPNLRLSDEAASAGTFSSDFATTQVRFYYMKSMGEQGILLAGIKKPVEITGVLPDKKYKAVATADVDNWGQNAGYFQVFSVNDEVVANMQAIECNRDQYINGVSTAAGKFLDASLGEFVKHAK